MKKIEADVIVVGGGPAGSTLATLLAQADLSVVLLERERFPRYHIGESLIPQVLDILEESGALPAVESAGFLRKEGGLFRWGASTEPWAVFFDELPECYGRSYAYQVERARFDQILLQQSKSSGARILEGARAVAINQQGLDRGYPITLTANWGDEAITLQASLIADCTGQSSWLGSQLRCRQFDPILRNVAFGSYFEGAMRLPGRDANSILCEAIQDGWIWYIPLNSDEASVGFVTSARSRLARQRRDSVYTAAIDSAPLVRELLADATQIGPLRSFRDYSYQTERLVAPGVIIVGDAAGFVDPLWSTGVFLALEGARGAAHAIIEWMETNEWESMRQYETSAKQLNDTYRNFVHFFYSANADRARFGDVFWKAFELLPTAIDQEDAFYRLISGRVGSADP